jgi:hypothetical protein
MASARPTGWPACTKMMGEMLAAKKPHATVRRLSVGDGCQRHEDQRSSKRPSLCAARDHAPVPCRSLIMGVDPLRRLQGRIGGAKRRRTAAESVLAESLREHVEHAEVRRPLQSRSAGLPEVSNQPITIPTSRSWHAVPYVHHRPIDRQPSRQRTPTRRLPERSGTVRASCTGYCEECRSPRRSSKCSSRSRAAS